MGIRSALVRCSDNVHTYNVYQHVQPALLKKIAWCKEPNANEESCEKQILATPPREKHALIDRFQD
jgi:hypothetical protein